MNPSNQIPPEAASAAAVSLHVIQNEILREEPLLEAGAAETEPAAAAPAVLETRKIRKASSRKPIVLVDSQGQEKTYGSALGALTRKFVDIIQSSQSGSIDMNETAAFLQVPKRRIYDITNVLEGVGILEKRSKNTVAWKGSEAILGSALDVDVKEQLDTLRRDINAYANEEELLDQWMAQLSKSNSTPASMSCSDVIEAFFHQAGMQPANKEDLVDELSRPRQSLLAIHGPHECLVQIPSPEYEGQCNRQLFVGTMDAIDKFDGNEGSLTGKKRKLSYERLMSSKTASRSDNHVSVFVLSTYFDDKEQKVMFSDLKALSNDEAKQERSTSWDLAETLANDEGVSDFIVAEEEAV
ncbi:hypothetical protein MPSEU_000960700 [Mayamaea pseudoterrestris]|nr:hypothetical protein MPSEU_000960700 [Mayamaea pseudoterrestris]